MNDNGTLAMFGQDTLEPAVRQAALAAAETILSRERPHQGQPRAAYSLAAPPCREMRRRTGDKVRALFRFPASASQNLGWVVRLNCSSRNMATLVKSTLQANCWSRDMAQE